MIVETRTETDAATNKSTIAMLTQIWERALQRSPIHPEENFYDLHGNDLAADKIFAEIAQTFDRRIPSATIGHVPTIAGLAALLEQPTLPAFSPFVPLKIGKKCLPILIAHGVGGRASFSELAKHIHTENPVYGIQARGVDGLEMPLEKIEDMADHYLHALHNLQPEGPYIFIGYSFGGLIALEMAQRLSQQGKRIALLALVDTYPHPRHLPPAQRFWLTAKRTKNRLADLRDKPLSFTTEKISRIIKRKLPVARSGEKHGNASDTSGLSFAGTALRLKHSDLLAMSRYRPRFYAGKINFIRPEFNSYLPNNPAAIWKHLAAEFEIETVTGDHLGMISTHFEDLAAVLTRHVREAAAK